MPIFKFKLDDTETGESRIVSVSADTMEEAEETVLRQEMKKVNLTLDPGELAKLEVLEKVAQNKKLSEEEEGVLMGLAREGAAGFGGRNKAQLYAHRQQQPYKINKGKEVEV